MIIMEKLRKFLNIPIVFSVVLNAAVLLISVTLFKPFFEENDDAFISMIAEGAYGAKEVHLIYTNVILGSVYKYLYSAYPAIRWHSVLQYVFLFIAFTSLTYIIQYTGSDGGKNGIQGEDKGEIPHGIKNRINKPVAVILALSTFHEVYVSVQYSKTAAFVCAIGYVLLLYGAGVRSEERDSVKRGALNMLEATGFILLIYGMLLRDSSFLLASLLMLPVCLYEFVTSVNLKTKCCGDATNSRKLRIYIFAFAPVLIWFVATKAFDSQAYNADEGWKSFMEYNDTRMELLDYRYDLLDRNKYTDRLKSEDISENDALMYLTWQFGDDSVLDTAKMTEILKDAPSRWSVLSCLKALASHIYEDVLILDPMIVGTLFFLMYAMTALCRRRRRNRGLMFAMVSQLIVFCGILVYYEYCGRWSHRIVFAAMLAVTVGLLRIWMVSCDAEEDTAAGKYTYAYAVVIMSCVSVLLGNRLDYNMYVREMPDYGGFFEDMAKDKDTLYIGDTFTFQYAYKYDVFKAYKEGSLDNFVTVGSWFVNSPVTRGITTKYGYNNPFHALGRIDDVQADGRITERVVLVDNMYPEEKLLYINEHYGDLNGKHHIERTFAEGSDDHGLQRYIVK